MKTKLTFLLLIVPMFLFAQMKREVLSYNGIQYLKYTPTTLAVQGAILYLHGLGERGTDITLVENNEIPKQLKAGMEVPFIVVAPQLPASYGGWWGNITYPMIDLIKTYNLTLHITGLSLGAMMIPTLVSQKPGVFATASTVCGQVDGSDPTVKAQIFAEFQKIPSIHYYDPSDLTISYGYLSVLDMCTQLKAAGSDITLVTLTGSPSPHTIWPQAYAATQYWQWLNSKTTAPAPVAPPATVAIDKQYRVGSDMVIESGGQKFKLALMPD